MKRIKISLVLNIIIFLLVTIICLFMFYGIRFMGGSKMLESMGFTMFKFFTIDSNILVGITSLILAIYQILYLKKKIDKIPNGIYIFKQVGVSAVALTFMVTLCFLAPMYGFLAMYNNNNLFLHAIIPILSFISYIGYEHHDNKYRYALYGIIPMAIYSIYYVSNILIHLDSGGVTFQYDWYGFLQGNINNFYIVLPIIYLVTYIFSLVIVFLNKKVGNKYEV